jgi:RNA polymerase sigma factor (sigma-70 family)
MDRHLIIEDFRHTAIDRVCVNDLLAALPGKQRRAVQLYMDGYTQIQIAEEMGIAPSSACSLLKRAITSCKMLINYPRKPFY